MKSTQILFYNLIALLLLFNINSSCAGRMVVYASSQGIVQTEAICEDEPEVKNSEEINRMTVQETNTSYISASNVAYRTQEEIAGYIANHKYDLQLADSFSSAPSYRSPYALGRLSDETLNNALMYTNVLRYIAGLSEEVSFDEGYIEYAQASSVVNAANGVLTHYPSQPADMSDELFQLGYYGSSHSNIAAGYSSIIRSISGGYMNDSDAGNIPMMGHRRWILDPRVSRIGFGAAGRYSAMFVIGDLDRTAPEYGVMWPARTMPVELFPQNWVWSISFGKTVSTGATVKLTHNNSGKTWNFRTSSADGDYYINNSGYGQVGCIIFRPNGNVAYQAGDTYTVEIKDIGISGMENSYTYEVNFFDLNSIQKNGIYLENGTYNYYANGAIQTQYNGLVTYNNAQWYVHDGSIDLSYSGLVLHQGQWYCIYNGKAEPEYTGLWYDPYVGWWYVSNGVIDFGYNGLIPNETGWWCVAGGAVRFEYTGLWYDPYVGWWYVSNGAIDFGYNGLIPNETGWWCVAGGAVRFEYTGLWYDPYVGWWYVSNGAIDFNYTGAVEYNGVYYDVENGRVIF